LIFTESAEKNSGEMSISGISPGNVKEILKY